MRPMPSTAMCTGEIAAKQSCYGASANRHNLVRNNCADNLGSVEPVQDGINDIQMNKKQEEVFCLPSSSKTRRRGRGSPIRIYSHPSHSRGVSVSVDDDIA